MAREDIDAVMLAAPANISNAHDHLAGPPPVVPGSVLGWPGLLILERSPSQVGHATANLGDYCLRGAGGSLPGLQQLQ